MGSQTTGRPGAAAEWGYVDPRLDGAFSAGVGFALVLTAAAFFAQDRSRLSPDIALWFIASVVTVFAWWSSPIGVYVTAGLGWLVLNGFVSNEYGVLTWHGSPDVVRLAVLLGCATVAAAGRAAHLSRRRLLAAFVAAASESDLDPWPLAPSAPWEPTFGQVQLNRVEGAHRA